MFDRKEKTNVLVQIASVVGAFIVAVTGVFGVFARDHMVVSAYIAGTMCVMGLGLGYFASRSSQESEEKKDESAT